MSLTDLDELTRRAASQDSRGGRRPGAGRPKGSKTKKKVELPPDAPPAPPMELRSVEQMLEDGPPPPIDDTGALNMQLLADPAVYYATGKARKELALAAKAELEYRIKLGQYLPREAVRSAVAKAFQAVAQSLRTIPDNLERKFGLSPEIAETVGIGIDETLGELSHSLEEIFIENNERDESK